MKTKTQVPLIFVTNDDGVEARGLHALIDIVRSYGDVIVVAPERSNSAKSHAVTLEIPIYYKKISEEEGLKIYSCSGTPVDCVKLGMNVLADRKPDFLVSGINHGSNASINVVYSGTMAAAMEGCINGVPSIGFSVTDHAENIDFSAAKIYTTRIFENLISQGLPVGTCLNVNIPYIKLNQIKGIKICRQTKGLWEQEFDKRSHPHGRLYFWLTGYYKNLEPEVEDTDAWALDNSFVSIVPIRIDMTDYQQLENLKKWNFEIKKDFIL